MAAVVVMLRRGSGSDVSADAAREAGASRIYGGIHFQIANVQGQILGKKVAAFAWEKASSHFAN